MQQQWEQLSNQLDTDHQVGLMKMTPDFVLIGLTNLTALFSYHLYFFNMFRMVLFTKCFCCLYIHLYVSPSLYYFCIHLWELSVFFYNSLAIFGWSLSLSLEYIHQIIVSKVGHFLIIIIIKSKSGKSRADKWPERREITQNPKTRNIKKIYFQCSLFKRTCLPALPNLWLLLV